MREVTRRRRDERGAVAVLTGAMLVAILVIAAFAVDLGMQRVGRRDAQTTADTVALDVGRLLDGRTTAEIKAGSTGRASLLDTLNRSVTRNDTSQLGSPPGDCSTVGGGTLSTVANTCVRAYLVTINQTDGSYSSTNGVPVETASGAVPTGVVVSARSNVGFVFSKIMGISGATVSRTGTSITEAKACFKLGSYGARVDSSNSALLRALLNARFLHLGGSVNLDALSYQGLASAGIGIRQLAVALGLSDPTQLASTTVTLRNFYLAQAAVLTQNGDTANAAVLNALASQVNSTTSINLGQVLDVSQGGSAATTATINALDLVAGSVFVVDGTSALSTSDLGTNIGLLGTGLTSTASIIEAARLYCNRVGATGSTAQVTVAVKGQLASAGAPSAIGSLTGLTASVAANSTDLSLTLAKATGVLTKIQCGSGTTASPEGVDVNVSPSLASISLKQSVQVSGSLTGSGVLGSLLGGLLGTIARVDVSGSVDFSISPVTQTTTPKTASIRVPNAPSDWSIPVSTGSGDLGLQSTPSTTLNLTLRAYTALGGTVSLSLSQQSSITDAIVSGLTSSIVNPLITSVNNNLVKPLSRLLGLQIGGADVYGVPHPSCTVPRIVGQPA